MTIQFARLNRIFVLVVCFWLLLLPDVFAAPLCKLSFVDQLKLKTGLEVSHKNKKVLAENLAKLIAVDKETAAFISDPVIAQYIYVNFFVENPKKNEVNDVLQRVVDSKDFSELDLFSLINSKLEEKLQDKELIAKVNETYKEYENVLRPGPWSTRTYAFRAKAKQAVNLFSSLSKIKKLVNEGMDISVMDQGLFDFYGATQLGLAESQLRPWDSTEGGLSGIRPGQVKNISPELWAKIAFFASETEAPIHGYSTNSGEALRALMPSVSLFMGKTKEQFEAYQESEAKLPLKDRNAPGKFCTNVWCREENRHEYAVKRMGEQVTGREHTEPVTYEADRMGDPLDLNHAIKHLIGRNSSEWNANSVYFFMRAHSEGPANVLVDNIRKDETKHMAIFAGAYKYLYGNNMSTRLKGMVEKILHLKRVAAVSNSNGNVLQGNALTLFEFGVTHYYVELAVQRYLKSLPLKTLAKIFDSEVKTIKPPESLEIDPEKERKIAEVAFDEKSNRERLTRWRLEDRYLYTRLKQYEEQYESMIADYVKDYFDFFRGAEVYNSREAKKVLSKISKIQLGTIGETDLLRLSLRELLRDYQIMNNQYVRARKDLVVYFKNVKEGFHVREREEFETEIIEAETVNSIAAIFRVARTSDMGDYKEGSAFEVTLETSEGKQSRVLSLASAPNKNYMSFSVGLSDSAFKEAVKRSIYHQGVKVWVKPISEMGFDFDYSRPMVFIAGGIGITPFRSAIQHIKETGIKQDVYLLYGNRSEASFMKELEQAATDLQSFKVIHAVSRPEIGKAIVADKEILSPMDLDIQKDIQVVGQRIDAPMIRSLVSKLPPNAKYYVVGSPDFVKGTEKSLLLNKVSKENVEIELFVKLQQDSQLRSEARKDEKKKEDETICFCHAVKKSTIQSIIDAGGGEKQIQTQTMATTGCGKCKGRVGSLLKMKN